MATPKEELIAARFKTFSRDSILGCIVGGAVGDLLGGVAERGHLSLSDDTQLTLATCEALSRSRGISPEAIAATFRQWFRAGAFSGLGSSTLKALRDLDAGAHWALSGARGERAAGNGAAMRVAPLAFFLQPLDVSHRVVIRDVCRITHHSDEAYIGALAVLVAIHIGLEQSSQTFFENLAEALPDSRVRDRIVAFADVSGDAPVSEVAARYGASGYVVETVPLALFLARRMRSEGLRPLLAELVRAGGDTDTIGSIAGQVAGAHLGFSRLQPEISGLPLLVDVIARAEAFADSCQESSV